MATIQNSPMYELIISHDEVIALIDSLGTHIYHDKASRIHEELRATLLSVVLNPVEKSPDTKEVSPLTGEKPKVEGPTSEPGVDPQSEGKGKETSGEGSPLDLLDDIDEFEDLKLLDPSE